MKKMNLLWIMAFLSFPNLHAQHQIKFDTPNPLADTPAWGGKNASVSAGDAIKNLDENWEHTTLPIGNGSIGGNVYGSIGSERITFNEKSLWRGGPNTSKGAAYYWNVNKESAHVLKDIRQAFMDNDTRKAAELTQNNFNSGVPYESNAEEPFRFGSFTTGGEFRIATGLADSDVTDYSRVLSLDSATVNIGFVAGGVKYTRTCFVSYPDNVMVVRFCGSEAGKQNLVFSYLPNPLSTGKYVRRKRGECCYVSSLDNNHMKYVVRVKSVIKGGKSWTDDEGRIHVENADEAVFLISADTDYRMNFDPDFTDPKAYVGENPLKTTEEWIRHASSLSYDELLDRHYRDYSSLFGRTEFELNTSCPGTATDLNRLSTPERLNRYRTGAPDYGLETLYYQFGRYLLISSSRPGNLPANLQGMWHNNVDGPWRVDYHNNINIQMNYWPACPTNLAECELPLIDFIRTQVKPGAVTAKSYFGARGWTTSISSNIFGFTTPLRDKDMSWNFSPVAGPWLATHVWNYYDYTRDLDFLRTVGYDLIKESARFAVDYLWHKPDGSYTAAPSTSPEHGPIDEGATFSHAVIREILLDAIAASKVLETDTAERQEWKQVLAGIVPYKIGRYGQLMEWSKDIDDPSDNHRHVNHLFGLHPGHTISPVTTPELAKASRVVLEHRGDGATGWSMGWKLNQWARLHDGNRSYTLYGNLLKNGTNENLWDFHPPFQIDGNFGGTAGVTEMLLQSHMGFIHLLPALPDVWHEGKLTGVRARGNFVIDMYWQDNNLTKAVVHSGSGVPCSIYYKGEKLEFATEAGGLYTVLWKDGKMKLE
ncbi:glycoside hydrolase N-terminal domain-containing protein [uncultured Phocaeicola sp.]|uniref:glycosyl hydrolase family 95 catalytic domain-containing protein n=1 Tax=uncultured Phocaeicola sp. TaxID=990718 RepID=UPI0025EEF9C5|nr:glycoside hydrolase N-terminal domain-containing protein [uncultured Phocaeicola sp.]